MDNIVVTNLRSVALRELNIGHPELANIINAAADEIERLLRKVDDLEDKIDSLHWEMMGDHA